MTVFIWSLKIDNYLEIQKTDFGKNNNIKYLVFAVYYFKVLMKNNHKKLEDQEGFLSNFFDFLLLNGSKLEKTHANIQIYIFYMWKSKIMEINVLLVNESVWIGY